MPNLSIKDVPEPVAQALRERAARNHRSLQGELMAIIESAAAANPVSQEPFGTSPAGSVAASDDLLGALDAMVAGSAWGSAPMLSREQANSRVEGEGGLQ